MLERIITNPDGFVAFLDCILGYILVRYELSRAVVLMLVIFEKNSFEIEDFGKTSLFGFDDPGCDISLLIIGNIATNPDGFVAFLDRIFGIILVSVAYIKSLYKVCIEYGGYPLTT